MITVAESSSIVSTPARSTVIISGLRESSVATQGSEQRPYQMLVDLQEIDGSWVVSKCSDVDSRFKK